MDDTPISTARRDMRRLKRLGPGPYICVLCGYSNPVALIPGGGAEVKDGPFEDHHVVGQHHDPHFMVLLCRNCHAEQTEFLLQAGVQMRSEPDPGKREVLRLKALATFHEHAAAAIRLWAADKEKELTK